jgi:HSP20 family protein
MTEKPAKSPSDSSTVPVRHATAERPGPLAPRWPLTALERELDRLFDDFRRSFFPRGWGPEATILSEVGLSLPAIDVFEKDDMLVVKADIPGMSKDDLEIELTESVLTIRGEKRREEEHKEHDYYRSERAFGRFSRTVELPPGLKTAEAKATFKDGVLEICAPRTEEAKHRRVKVKVE